MNGLPPAQGLYDPANEHDACGIGFVASIRGHKSHDIIRKGIQVLINLTHRGACGCDPLTGDGAGILLQLPHEFFVKEGKKRGIKVPGRGEYGAGCVFLPRNAKERRRCQQIVEDKVLAGERILAKVTRASGNGAPIGGLKVMTANGWFAARPSGTEDVYKIYAESFLGTDHLRRIQDEARALVARLVAAVGDKPRSA